MEDKRKEQISKYKRKAVQGLYIYDHFENEEDGSFIQIPHAKGSEFVFYDKDKKFHYARNLEALKEKIFALYGI